MKKADLLVSQTTKNAKGERHTTDHRMSVTGWWGGGVVGWWGGAVVGWWDGGKPWMSQCRALQSEPANLSEGDMAKFSFRSRL